METKIDKSPLLPHAPLTDDPNLTKDQNQLFLSILFFITLGTLAIWSALYLILDYQYETSTLLIIGSIFTVILGTIGYYIKKISKETAQQSSQDPQSDENELSDPLHFLDGVETPEPEQESEDILKKMDKYTEILQDQQRTLKQYIEGNKKMAKKDNRTTITM